MQLCSLFELPSDVLLHSLSFLPLPDLAALRCTSQRGRRLALRAAASPMWRARRGHASALRLEMWRRGACDKRALEGGAYGRAHRHAPLARCCALTAAAADTTAGPLLASADDSGAVVVWETQRRLAGVATLRHGRPVRCLALDGRETLASGCADGSLWLWAMPPAGGRRTASEAQESEGQQSEGQESEGQESEEQEEGDPRPSTHLCLPTRADT
mmetsp:Transcript_12397/g.39523  ORF Transcript_12397/g.39523 Transcript_12397/m.39523 type:complete len:215 (+) Transcript_12397:95-739(+)